MGRGTPVAFSEGECRYRQWVIADGGLELPLKIRLTRMGASVTKPGKWLVKMHRAFVSTVYTNEVGNFAGMYIRFAARGDVFWVLSGHERFTFISDLDLLDALDRELKRQQEVK